MFSARLRFAGVFESALNSEYSDVVTILFACPHLYGYPLHAQKAI